MEMGTKPFILLQNVGAEFTYVKEGYVEVAPLLLARVLEVPVRRSQEALPAVWMGLAFRFLR
jgi:hypothetical protein